MQKARYIGKTAIFLLILMISVSLVQGVFSVGKGQVHSREVEFSTEKPGSLDAVYIGSSHVHRNFIPSVAWEDYGITVFDLSHNWMPHTALKYRIIDARKTQPDALYIINLNAYRKTVDTVEALHYNLDYMPFSLNKLKMTAEMCRMADISGLDALEFYLPVIRFHERWSDLETEDFIPPNYGYKGAYYSNEFMTAVFDNTKNHLIYNDEDQLSDGRRDSLEDLLDYCDQNNVKALFVTVPMFFVSSEYSAILQAEEIVKEHGYDTLNLIDPKDVGIVSSIDFMDTGHFNIHGAIKYTDYLSRYLIDHYGFEDKRGQKEYASWDESIEEYNEKLLHYILPFEREHLARDYDLMIPDLSGIKIEDHNIVFSWSVTDSAEAYEIYRKTDSMEKMNWEYLDTVSAATTKYTDKDLESGVTYTYTVVPVRRASGQIIYGNFDYRGISIVFE